MTLRSTSRRSCPSRSGFPWLSNGECLCPSLHREGQSRTTEPIAWKLPSLPLIEVSEGRSNYHGELPTTPHYQRVLVVEGFFLNRLLAVIIVSLESEGSESDRLESGQI